VAVAPRRYSMQSRREKDEERIEIIYLMYARPHGTTDRQKQWGARATRPRREPAH